MFWQVSFNYEKFSKMDRVIQEGMQELPLSSAIYLEILMALTRKATSNPIFKNPDLIILLYLSSASAFACSFKLNLNMQLSV